MKTLRHEVVEARAQAQAHLNAKLQLGGHFAKKEVQLKEKLAKIEEQYKSACRGISTMQNTRDQAQRAKAALEENLKKVKDDRARLVEELRTAKAEVDMLKRRSQKHKHDVQLGSTNARYLPEPLTNVRVQLTVQTFSIGRHVVSNIIYKGRTPHDKNNKQNLQCMNVSNRNSIELFSYP